MRTRKSEWINTETLEPVYGFQVHHEGKWKHAAENGEPCLFKTRAERDAKRAEFRNARSPNPRRRTDMAERFKCPRCGNWFIPDEHDDPESNLCRYCETAQEEVPHD